MGTKKRIETGSDIWEAALFEPPVDKRLFPGDYEPEQPTISDAAFFLLAAVGSVATVCGVAGLISWLFFRRRIMSWDFYDDWKLDNGEVIDDYDELEAELEDEDE